MIPTYNCADYLGEALASVVAQDPGQEWMQIEVVDDASDRDDPARVVRAVGGGRVGFYRQPANVGHCRNFNTCLRRARGRLVHLLHGDDAVRPGFYAEMQRTFTENPAIGAAFCRHISINEQGHWLALAERLQAHSGVVPRWLEKIATGQWVQPPAVVVRRDVYERLGGFDQRIAQYGEDWEMWVRIAAQYHVWYNVRPLALYRVRAASLSGRSLVTGDNARDFRLAIEINRAYLPRASARALTAQARRNFALACVRRAHRLLGAGCPAGAAAQAREALRTDRSAGVLARALYFGARWWLSGQRRSPCPDRPSKASADGTEADPMVAAPRLEQSER